jgi:hypothetical protein
MPDGGRNPAILSRRNGADDESSRRAFEGLGEEDHLVGGGRNHRGKGSDDAQLTGGAGEERPCRTRVSAQRKSEQTAQAGAAPAEAAATATAWMLQHTDGGKPRWLNDDRRYDLLVILDYATSEIY